jgi:3-deoxy-D-manno-octulosonic-acid transferase
VLIIYDLIFIIVALLYLPAYLLKKKLHRGFLMRLGILPKVLKLDRPIWVHAVSVGEAMAIRGLLEGLRKAYPAKKIVISTVTATGNKIAKSIAHEGDFVTYLPLDLGFIVRKTIAKINPSLFIIAETEIWPNLITCLNRKNVPVIVVNGRISDRSFQGYMAVKFFLKAILNKVSLFCVQSERDSQRLIDMGVHSDKVAVAGNMKFDTADYTDIRVTDCTDLKTKLWLDPEGKLIVAGSTHPGEEEIILSAYEKLLPDFPAIRLLIAPRHPERADEVAEISAKYGFRPAFISWLGTKCEVCSKPPVFILDTIGKLMDFYGLADIVFVGGSLINKGGHNILEPASLAKPILFGPQMFNFRDIADLFLENNACILVRNEEEIRKAIRDLLGNPAKMATLGQRAQGLIVENQGATRRTLELIKQYA